MASKYSFCPCSSSPRDSRSAAVASFDGGSIVRRSGGFTCTGSACDICAKETVARQTQEARTATGTRPFGQSAIGHTQVNLFWHSSSHPNQAFRSRKGCSESREPKARFSQAGSPPSVLLAVRRFRHRSRAFVILEHPGYFAEETLLF